MRYVIVGFTPRDTRPYVDSCNAFLASEDELAVVCVGQLAATEVDGTLYFPLQWSRALGQTVLRRAEHRLRRVAAMAPGVRRLSLHQRERDVLINIAACDPDVIDLRPLGTDGEVLEPRVRARFAQAVVLAGREEFRRDDVDEGWRRYDPREKVSIVLPVLNGARYLPLSIESCLQQSHRALELIVVDDGSTDETPRILADYARRDDRVRVIRNEANRGVPESLNIGFAQSTGSLLTWTSDDNLYAPGAIGYMVQQLCTFPEIGLVYCAMWSIGANGRLMHIYPVQAPSELRHANVVGGCFMYRRAVADAVGGYRPEYRMADDYDYWVRICTRFGSRHLYWPRYFYRFHEKQMTRTHGHKFAALSERLQAEHFGRGGSILFDPERAPAPAA